MKKIITITLLSMVGLTSGCRTLVPPARERSVIPLMKDGTGSSVHHIDYDITRRGAFVIKNADGRLVTISEPAPDAGIETITSLLAKVPIEGISAEAKVDITEKLTQFGTRTQMVMFLRESLFRLTEIGQNSNFTVTQYTEAYNKVIDAALKLVDTELQLAQAASQRASAAAAQALANKANAEANEKVAEAKVKSAEASLQAASAEKIKQNSALFDKINKATSSNPALLQQPDIMNRLMAE